MVRRPKRLINWCMVSWSASMNSPHHSACHPIRPGHGIRVHATADAMGRFVDGTRETGVLQGESCVESRNSRSDDSDLGHVSSPLQVTRAGCTSDTKTLSLVLTLVLPLGEFDGNVGHVIPGVVDADEQEQHRCSGDDEQCRCRMAWEQKRRDDEGSVGDQRKDRMKQPVFQYRLIVRLPAHPPEYDVHVDHPPETRKAQQQTSIPERLPGCTEYRGDQQRDAK